MLGQLESLPNELFLHGIFPYLSSIDLQYAFLMLNQRFKVLLSSFLAESCHRVDLTRDITSSHFAFIMDSILPLLHRNHQLQTVELMHAHLSSKFLRNLTQINTDYLTKLIIIPYIDIEFEFTTQVLSKCPQLQELKLNLLTNLDRTWANGRKLARWFESMLQIQREHILKIIDICVWCINSNDAMNFDRKLWDDDGVFRKSKNWKVQLKPDEITIHRQRRQSVECSRTFEMYDEVDPSCKLS